jgi:hypothetical protein
MGQHHTNMPFWHLSPPCPRQHLRRTHGHGQRCGGSPQLADLTAAAQLIAVQLTLARDNIARLAAGQTADDRYPAAVQDAEHGYALLHDGLGTLPPMR